MDRSLRKLPGALIKFRCPSKTAEGGALKQVNETPGALSVGALSKPKKNTP